MVRFITYRALQAVITVIVVSVVVFLMVQASGDPAALLVAETATVEDIAKMRTNLGLNRPLHVQYLSFMIDFWRGQSIRSFRYDQPVVGLVLGALRWTAVLAGGALCISVVIGIPLGTLAAVRRGGLLDLIIRVVAVFGQSMPSFWVAMLLMLFVSVKLQWLPVSGLGALDKRG